MKVDTMEQKAPVEKDWQGNIVIETETPDTIIKVWVITPGGPDCDEVWIRDYNSAVAYATERLEDIVDSAEEDDLLEHGVGVRMKIRRMRLSDYLEVVNSDRD